MPVIENNSTLPLCLSPVLYSPFFGRLVSWIRCPTTRLIDRKPFGIDFQGPTAIMQFLVKKDLVSSLFDSAPLSNPFQMKIRAVVRPPKGTISSQED